MVWFKDQSMGPLEKPCCCKPVLIPAFETPTSFSGWNKDPLSQTDVLPLPLGSCHTVCELPGSHNTMDINNHQLFPGGHETWRESRGMGEMLSFPWSQGLVLSCRGNFRDMLPSQLHSLGCFPLRIQPTQAPEAEHHNNLSVPCIAICQQQFL